MKERKEDFFFFLFVGWKEVFPGKSIGTVKGTRFILVGGFVRGT
jgi:hypothetical protein